jgi:MFS family permease
LIIPKTLQKFPNPAATSPQIAEEVTKLQSNEISTSKWQLGEFKHPQLYKPFLMMLAFFTIQQFSGIFTIFIFASQFSIEAGVAIDPFLSAVIIGVVRMTTTFVFAFISDKSGRRPLAIISSCGMFLAMVGLVLCGNFQDVVKNSQIFWLPTALIYFFIFTGTFGILSLPFAMLGEVYPQKSRGLAAGLTISYAYTMSFVNVKTFAMVFEYFGSTAMFGFYAGMAIIGIIFSTFCLVETKGKSLQEIEEHFKGKLV